MIKVYDVKPVMNDIEAEHTVGQFINQYSTVIDHDCDVYYTDSTNVRKVLLIFRKNVVPIEYMKTALKVFKHDAQKATSIRGKAGGKVTPSLVSANVERVVNPQAFRSKIVYKNGQQSSYYVSNKVNSMIVGYFDKEKISERHDTIVNKLNGCRTTAFTEQHNSEWESVIPLFQCADKFYKTYMPINHDEQYQVCSQTPNYQIRGTAFSTITVNYNWQTACHTDSGDYHNGYSVLLVAEEGNYSGGILGYPQFDVGVDVRQGDFLLINPHLHHANTPLINNEPTKEFTRLSMVMYYREGMLKCRKASENNQSNVEPQKFKINLKKNIPSGITKIPKQSQKFKVTIKSNNKNENENENENRNIFHTTKIKNTNINVELEIRPDTTDIKVIDEVLKNGVYQKPSISFKPENKETWLDLGGNIGTFALYAMSQGCNVISYEPEPQNCNLFKINLSKNEHLLHSVNWKLIEKAIGTYDGETELYLCKGTYNKYRHTLYKKRGRQSIKIPICSFKNEMNKYKPDGIKIDIEGTEIDILESITLSDWKHWNTKKLVFEYSFDIDPSIPRFIKIIQSLRQYFSEVHYTKVKENELEYKHFPAMTIVYCIL